MLRSVDKVDLEGGHGDIANRNEPSFAAFTERRDDASTTIHVRQLQLAELTHAQTSRVHELQHGSIASTARMAGIGSREESQDLLHREHLREPGAELRSLNQLARILREDPLLNQVTAESADRGKMARGRTRADTIAPEAHEKACYGARGDGLEKGYP